MSTKGQVGRQASAEQEITFTFAHAGHPCNVTYFSAALTLDAVAELRRLGYRAVTHNGEEEAAQVLLAFGAWYCRIIAAWDHTDPPRDDGGFRAVVPINPLRLAREMIVDQPFMLACAYAIVADYSRRLRAPAPPARKRGGPLAWLNR